MKLIFFLFYIILFQPLTDQLIAKLPPSSSPVDIELGVDRIFTEPYISLIKGKKVGLITNQTGVTKTLEPTIQFFLRYQKIANFSLKALFAPEHGLFGEIYAEQKVPSLKFFEKIPVYSLYGDTRRPTKEMLAKLDLLVFDIQDVGTRPYTFATTLFYAMEEAAKQHIPVVVLDRPNPINGLVIDGPMLEKEFRSFIGYINIPYCHGMTIAELARFFNDQYQVACDLHVVPMKGWKRAMNFQDTGLAWIPTSPNIPEASTTLVYPITGLLGDIGFVSIGIGYTLPFKVVGAPWIQADDFATLLNSYKLPGIFFHPTRFRPMTGRFATKTCQGVLIVVKDPSQFLPVTSQFAILSAMKELYPKELQEALSAIQKKPSTFFLSCGTKAIIEIIQNKESPFPALRQIHTQAKNNFLLIRKKYLLSEYQ